MALSLRLALSLARVVEMVGNGVVSLHEQGGVVHYMLCWNLQRDGACFARDIVAGFTGRRQRAGAEPDRKLPYEADDCRL